MNRPTLRPPQSLVALALLGALAACNTNDTVGANDGKTQGAGGQAATSTQSTSSTSSSSATGAGGAGGGQGGGATGGGSAGGSGGATGAGGAAGGMGGAGGAPATCNGLTEQGAGYAFSAQPPPAPAPSGGTIADGTYVIASEVAYTKTNQQPAQVPQGWTLQISGTTMNRVVGNVHQTYQMSTAGTQLTRLALCDSETPAAVGTSSTVGYTATADQLSEFLPWDFGQGLEMEVFVWKRLP